MVSVYVAVVPVTEAVPGDVAVTEHWPADSAVRTFWLITHGPDSPSTTVAPDAALAVRVVLVPALMLAGRPGFHGVPPEGITVIESPAFAGWMLTVWLDVPLKPPVELENWVLIVWTPDAVGVHEAATPPVESVGVEPMIPIPSKKNDALPAGTPVPVWAPRMVGVPTYSTGGNRRATVTTEDV